MDEAVRASVKRVLTAIPDPSAKALVSDLLRLSVAALHEFAALDETVYRYFSGDSFQHDAAGEDALDNALTELMLNDVYTTTFRGIRKLSSFLSAKGLVTEEGAGEREFDSSDDFTLGEEFDKGFDDLISSSLARPRQETLTGIDEFEIEKALGMLAEDDDADFQDKLQDFRKQVSTLGFVLQQQVDLFTGRIDAAMKEGRFDLVLRELDGSCESLTEGLFALVSAVFEIFSGHVERADLLPGYQNALQQSLMLRRGLADLTAVVTAENEWVIQDADLPKAAIRESIQQLAKKLSGFMEGEVFRAMRAPDRLELKAFYLKIHDHELKGARLACEGLAKYLESLSIINQREVLLEHDQATIAEIKQSVEAVRSLVLVSISGAKSLMLETIELADKLYGRNPSFDQQVLVWKQDESPLNSADGIQQILTTVEEMLR